MIDVPARVKDALREGNYKKNYIFNVLNDDGTTDFTIDNDTLVSESVKIDERMCTGNDLKFGLCEGSSLEFQYFDHPNITGRQIQAFVEVQYVDGNGDLDWHTIPMGFFTVDQCPMQFSTGIRKVTAYNKLKSAYLDQKCNTILVESLDDPNIQVSVIGLRNYFLSDFEVKPYGNTLSPDFRYTSRSLVSAKMTFTDRTNVSTPINYYNVGRTNACYIGIRAAMYSYTVDSNNYYQFIETIRKYYDCQLSLISYLINMVDNSSVDISGADVWDSLNTETTWKQCFSVALIDENNTAKYYSDYAYKNGIAGIDGTVNDLIKMLVTGVSRISIYIPEAFTLYRDAGIPTEEYSAPLTGTEDIQYVIDSQSTTATYPVMKYPDGEYIPAYTLTGPMIYHDWFNVYDVENLNPADLIVLDPETMPDFTLRDLISASYETVAQYGKLDRQTDLFAGVELNYSRLLPADTLYPNDSLYPGGNSLRSDASMYQKLWTDSQGVQTFRYLIITYKAMEDNKEVEKTLQRTINTNGTTDYYMSDNWLFKNLIWTEQAVGEFADAMVPKMQNVSWFPYEMWCAGLPYIETGDELEITNSEGTYTSYVLQRQLNGIQNLQDTYINGELDIF